MKLRFTPNSVRLRLNQTEVTKLAESGLLSERVDFPGPVPSSLVYSLRLATDSEIGLAHLEEGEFTVTVPQEQAKIWANTVREVGLYYKHDLPGGGNLRIAIEKDFQCVDGPPEEHDPAAYPNPLAKIGCKTDK